MRNRLKTFADRIRNGNRSRTSTPTQNNQEIERALPTGPDMDETRKLLNQVRKWGIFYNGKSSQDAVMFLEKLADLKEEYGIEDTILLRALPELFKDKASIWFRINKSTWSSWSEFLEEFKVFYFPESYIENLEEEISQRKQKNKEKGKDYVLDLQSMMKRHGGYSKEKELRILYNNLDSSYKYYIRQKDVTDLKTLLVLIEEYEKLQVENSVEARGVERRKEDGRFSRDYRSPERNFQSMSVPNADNSNRRDVGNGTRHIRWQNGNRRSEVNNTDRHHQAENRRELRCFGCGREGLTLRTCTCRWLNQGNSNGTGQNRGMVSSARN